VSPETAPKRGVRREEFAGGRENLARVAQTDHGDGRSGRTEEEASEEK